ncbi:hypothetical protein [Nonomuraea sp. NPDC049480]|uniref:hypothetical protein n=1 Tax=Nonomuraea sp. NPDC049480 TaxID=3364353 RepID=UPI0037A5344C
MTNQTEPVAAAVATGQTLPLARAAGPLTLAAGLALVLTQLVQIATLDVGDWAATLADPLYVGNAIAQFIAMALLVVAAVAIYQRQAARAGWFGVTALITVLLGTVHLAGDYWFEGFASPWIAQTAPQIFGQGTSGVLLAGGRSAYVLFAVGWVLFGASCLRAGALPKAIAITVIATGAVAVLMGQPPLGVPLGLALTWAGLWTMRS